QEALEWPQVTRQPAALAARQNSTAPGSSAAHVADLMIPRARGGSYSAGSGLRSNPLGCAPTFSVAKYRPYQWTPPILTPSPTVQRRATCSTASSMATSCAGVPVVVVGKTVVVP